MTKSNEQAVQQTVQQEQEWFFNRKHKDFLFGFVLSDKKMLLKLYNALNETDYEDEEDLQINTLKDAIYLGYKNDLSFMIGDTLNLYEHQSTFNPNMPLRGLLYITALFESIISLTGGKLYSKSLIRLPIPRYIVFYNGETSQPERLELRLSDAYQPIPEREGRKAEEARPCLEFTATVLNINYGHNKEILERCRELEEYAVFIEKVRVNRKSGMPMEKALEAAIDDCIREDVLRDILLKNKAEVMKVLLTQFDAEEYKANLYAEGREEGHEEGHVEGYNEGHEEERENGIHILIEAYQEDGTSEERILEKLQSKYSLTSEEAEHYLEQSSKK